MRLHAPIIVSTLALTTATTLVARAEVTIETNGDTRHIAAPAYEATIEPDGCLTSLRVAGHEFLRAAPGNPRGFYTYQDGPLQLPTIEQPSASSVIARCDKAEVHYDFADDAITWTISNPTGARLLALMVLDPAVFAVRNEWDEYEKTPTEVGTKRCDWFIGESKVTVTGGTRIWGPWGDGLQVWESGIEPGATCEVTVTVGVPTEDEAAHAAAALAYSPEPPTDPVGPMWDLGALGQAPAFTDAEGFEEPGVRAIFYDGPDYRGKPTRVFAWLGLPEVKQGERVPGIVLVHGGGGTAFAEWVRLWTGRGYAAIAMDTCGCVPRGTYGNWERHPDGGPAGWGGFNQIDRPRTDQWAYHAVADAVLANSLLRSLPEVDPDRIGLTGISWGGYLTCIIAGVDSRLRFAVPVYGCGFTLDMSFAGSVSGLGEERAARWMRWWDPSVYLPDAKMPMLWVTGSNDFAYTFNALQMSYRLPTGPRTLCIRLRMPHGHGGAGENPEEIHIFADSIVNGGEPLVAITGQGRDADQVWATFAQGAPVVRAELNVTSDVGPWPDREWVALPAAVEATAEGGRVTATLPEGTTVYYLNLYDDRDAVVSTEHEELPAKE
jgi:dienelactone hydrolase